VAGLHAEGAAGVDLVGERHTVATRQHDSPDSKGAVDVIASSKSFMLLRSYTLNVVCYCSKNLTDIIFTLSW